jgi:hypothetical protein
VYILWSIATHERVQPRCTWQEISVSTDINALSPSLPGILRTVRALGMTCAQQLWNDAPNHL